MRFTNLAIVWLDETLSLAQPEPTYLNFRLKTVLRNYFALNRFQRHRLFSRISKNVFCIKQLHVF